MSIWWRKCDILTRGPSAQGFSPALGKFKHQWRAVNGFTTGRQSPAAQRRLAARGETIDGAPLMFKLAQRR